ncbi:MAG: NADAR family protein [Leptolyngbya sp. RL_3_1]|nr:NADAR family protein [Leptolyngbya sp. RL_3_1]
MGRKPIYFYIAREEPYGCFSNFSWHGFTLDGQWWPTSEHYFQAQKFMVSDRPWAAKIQQAKTPKIAATMGRSRKHPIRPDWDAVKDDIMTSAVRAKFQAHAEIRQLLLATEDAVITENSPIDYYWGCGADGSGQNQLGQILMAVRQSLRNGQMDESLDQ